MWKGSRRVRQPQASHGANTLLYSDSIVATTRCGHVRFASMTAERMARSSAVPRDGVAQGPTSGWLPGLATVAIPTYNRCTTLENAVAAACQQDYPQLEVLIVDDASTDSTASVGQRLAKADSRITYFRHETNIGPAANYGAALRLAHGRYFMWLADDDWITPDYLRRCIARLEAGRHAVVVGQDYLGQCASSAQRDVSIPKPVAAVLDRSPEKRVLSTAGSNGVVNVSLYGVIHRETGIDCLPYPNASAGDRIWTYKLLLRGTLDIEREVGLYRAEGGISSDSKKTAVLFGASSFASQFPSFTVPVNVFRTLMQQYSHLRLGGLSQALVFSARVSFVTAVNAQLASDLAGPLKGAVRRRVSTRTYSRMKRRYRHVHRVAGHVRGRSLRMLGAATPD